MMRRFMYKCLVGRRGLLTENMFIVAALIVLLAFLAVPGPSAGYEGPAWNALAAEQDGYSDEGGIDYNLPDTGQMICYDTDGYEAACEGDGQAWGDSISDGGFMGNDGYDEAADKRLSQEGAVPGVNWTVQTIGKDQTYPIDSFNDVASSGSIFVAVGTKANSGGSICTSGNGISWTVRASGLGNVPEYNIYGAMYSVVWSGKQFVAVGSSGVIMTSPDGLLWKQRTSGTTKSLYDIVWNGKQYAAVGSLGTIITSSDGVVWVNRSLPAVFFSFAGITWSGSKFVTVSDFGNFVTSKDGITWTQSSSGISMLNDVVWSGTQFAAVGSFGKIYTSPDGATWTPWTSGTNYNLRKIVWNGSLFVTAGDNGTILSSSDGATWTAENSATFPENFNGLTWTGSQFIAVGNEERVVTSPDGNVWTPRTLGMAKQLYSIARSGTQFAVVGSNTAIYTSPDGKAWTPRASGLSNSELAGAYLNRIIWSGKKFVAVGFPGLILTSPDGLTWTRRTSGTAEDLKGITWSGSLYVVVGNGGLILTSLDGVIWKSQESGITKGLDAVAWSGTKFVAVGAVDYGGGIGTVVTSPDGKVWASGSVAKNTCLYGLVWNGKKFVAVGESNSIQYSADGITWKEAAGTTSVLGTALWDVVWTGTQFVTVGGLSRNGNDIYTSSDGVTWTSRTPGTEEGLHALVWTGTRLIAVGAFGSVLTSSNGQYELGVDKTGVGAGKVVSSPAGITCGNDCSGGYDPGTIVTLTATPALDSVFGSWQGCGTVSGNKCTVTMGADKIVKATFFYVTYKISGKVTTSGGSPISGTTVKLKDIDTGTIIAKGTTNSLGEYTFTRVKPGSYKLALSKAGYKFTPSYRLITLSTADLTAENFVGKNEFSVSGYVKTSAGAALAGVDVGLSGGSNAAVKTDEAGKYTFSGLLSGSYTVTPSKAGYVFSPVSIGVTVNTSNVTGKNFTGTEQ